MDYKETWFITGASTGLGLHLAKGLLQNGHRVAAIARDKEALRSLGGGLTMVADEGAGTGWREGHLLCLTADLTNEDSVQAAIQRTIGQFGRIDNVVNYGGYDLPGSIEALSGCEIHQYFEENVFGTFYVLKQVIPYLCDQRSGTILNFSSAAVAAAVTGSTLYAATKLAIESLSEELTADIEDLGIQQTFIGPAASLQKGDATLSQNGEEGVFFRNAYGHVNREQAFQRAALLV